MNNSSAGLIETRHALPKSERETVQAVLAKVLNHMSRSDRPLRESYDIMMDETPTADGVTFSAVDQREVRGWWVRASESPLDRAILYLHGGGYYMGSARAYRGFVSQIASRVRVDVFIPDYPLAPEYPFPAAYEAVLSVRGWMATQGIKQVALIGDSAGGGLALAVAAQRGALAPPIAAIVAFSPWVDLALTGSSLKDANTHDPILGQQGLAASAGRYLNGADARDGRASPLYSIPSVFPPLAIQVGTNELLLDDARRYAVAAAERGGGVHLDIFEDLHHVFQIAVNQLPSAGGALDIAAEFLSRHWRNGHAAAMSP